MLKLTLFLFFSVLLFSKVCNSDLAKDIKILKTVNTLALETKESGLKTLKQKTEELFDNLKRVRHSTPSKILNCGQTLTKLLESTSKDLEICVDKHTDELISLIHDKNDLSDKESDKRDYCIKSAEKCSLYCDEDVEYNSTKKIESENMDLKAIEKKIELIRDCVKKAIEKSNGFARRCVL